MIDLTEHVKLENSDVSLTWGADIEQLHNQYGTNRHDKGDRTVYEWGQQQILNGLELSLSSMYWNFGDEEKDRLFDRVEFWATGDNPAKGWFERISKHLTKELGEPTTNETINDGDLLKIWQLKGAILKLHIFEQHAYRTHFRIEKK